MEELPKPKYEQALVELEAFKTQPIPQTKKDLASRNSTQYYLEQRLTQIRNEVEAEQKTYDLARKECEISWNEYRDLFYGYNLYERLFSPSKISDIRLLRRIFSEALHKVNIEKEKFGAQNRVRAHEERSINEREEEIERKTSKSKLSEIKLPDAEDNTSLAKSNSEEESENHYKPEEIQADTIPFSSNIADHEEGYIEQNFDTLSTQQHFGQEDFLTLHPNFQGLTYIDESLSLDNIDLPIVTDAIFDNSFFVSVYFTGRHQYQNCSFISTDFSHTVWHQSQAPHRIVNCDLSKSSFSGAELNYLAFYNCRFYQTTFLGVQLNMVKFVKCTLVQCSLKRVDFSRSVMSKDMLENIDFSECLHVPKNHANFLNHENSENDKDYQ